MNALDIRRMLICDWNQNTRKRENKNTKQCHVALRHTTHTSTYLIHERFIIQRMHALKFGLSHSIASQCGIICLYMRH